MVSKEQGGRLEAILPKDVMVRYAPLADARSATRRAVSP